MKKINVLVTGAGSGVGQGIIKSLQVLKKKIKIFCADINKENAGLYFNNNGLIIPKVESKNALAKLVKIIKNKNIRVIFVGSELELLFFSKNKSFIEENTKSIINVSPLKTIIMANDKYKTYNFFKKKLLPFAETFSVKNILQAKNIYKKIKFPFFLKSRVGTSSRGVYLINNSNEIKSLFKIIKKPIIQRIAGIRTEEYTASVFKTKEGTILGPFIAKRILKGGTSWIINVSNYPRLIKEIKLIAKNIDFIGSLNIQFQIFKKKIIPFEINSRISGTVAVRSFFGFNEPVMFVNNYFFKKKIMKPKIKKGVCFRYHNEIFLKNKNLKKISLSKGLIYKWF